LTADIAIVGAGAAGLATAIFARRANPGVSVLMLDSAMKPGAKILVSGGGRCNVTNRVVTELDFWGGRRSIVKRVLQAFTADETVRFFRELGLPLREEADGKLFPVSGRARDVLTALLHGASEAGAQLLLGHRVVSVEPIDGLFRIATSGTVVECRRVVLATGGRSLPKTGSDGTGLDIARRLGHTIVATTPALAPLVLGGTSDDALHRDLSGVSHDAELAIWIDGRISTRLRGSLLWTHFGISGPVALNASRHWLRADLEGRPVRMPVSFAPGRSYRDQEAWWAAAIAARPKATALNVLATLVPTAVAGALVRAMGVDPGRQLAHLTRSERNALTGALLERPLPIVGCRGWNHAEATAGGVSLDEIDPSTMASRMCPGLYLVGEMLDVDGRIGGFNFQWAWSTAHVAGQAIGYSM
jgi:predicted Rossmann fold flavoprotein